jgi:flagellar assembly factor FliW
MPHALTAQFGTLDFEDDAVLSFPAGLPGFEHCRQFVLLEQPGLAPLVHLQSLEMEELCFLALPVQAIDAAYQPVVLPEDLNALGLSDIAQPSLLLALLAVAPDGSLTANLMAPVVVNLATRVAVQAVRADTRYSHEHALWDQSGEPGVCS